MPWNWQHPDWPHFTWDRLQIAGAEEQFLLGAGVAIGSSKHLGERGRTELLVELMTSEAITTSKIEGEVLNHFEDRGRGAQPRKRAILDSAPARVGRR